MPHALIFKKKKNGMVWDGIVVSGGTGVFRRYGMFGMGCVEGSRKFLEYSRYH